jgi:hypothetical protein
MFRIVGGDGEWPGATAQDAPERRRLRSDQLPLPTVQVILGTRVGEIIEAAGPLGEMEIAGLG